MCCCLHVALSHLQWAWWCGRLLVCWKVSEGCSGNLRWTHTYTHTRARARAHTHSELLNGSTCTCMCKQATAYVCLGYMCVCVCQTYLVMCAGHVCVCACVCVCVNPYLAVQGLHSLVYLSYVLTTRTIDRPQLSSYPSAVHTHIHRHAHTHTHTWGLGGTLASWSHTRAPTQHTHSTHNT